MALPVHTLVLPACLAGQSNGKLDPSILWTTPGQQGGADVTLVEPAARAWRALTSSAKHNGHVLKSNSAGRSYRSYEEQKAIFLDRYYPSWSGRIWWEGRLWKKKQGVAAAARPGTSNHGWGLAVDVTEERDGDAGGEPFDYATLTWLKANAHKFGFSWEIQSEPWHMRYYAGDDIPVDILFYEFLLNPPTSPIVLTEDEEMQLINDSKQKKNFAGWIGPEGYQYILEYDNYTGAGTDMPNISYVIRDMAARNLLKIVKK